MSKIWGLLSTDSCRHTFGPTADNLLSALSALHNHDITCLFNNVNTLAMYHEEESNLYITHNIVFFVYLSVFSFSS